MGEEVNMSDYGSGSGSGSGDDDQLLDWEAGLPGANDLTPLSQVLIPPELASLFNILPERRRTLGDVNRASEETISGLRGGQLPTFAHNIYYPGDEANGSRDLVAEDTEDERSDSRKLRRLDSTEEADSALRGENSNSIDDQSARNLKKPRLVWTPQLHKRFVDVVSHLGIKNAVPKTIMQLMNVEGLSRENVASHLQKYRLYLKRMQGLSNEGPSSSDPLFASTPIPPNLNDNGRNGNANGSNGGHMPMHMQMPYGPMVMHMPMYGMGHHHGNVHGHGHMGMPMGNHPHPYMLDL
ncbi:hypothetical protein V2J09_011836 [Rumex salicifolius]